MKNKIVSHFYSKESKKDSNGEAPIYLRITINGERAEISTNRRISSDLLDKASERVTGRSESARVINSHLNNLVGKVEKYFSGLDAKNIKTKKTISKTPKYSIVYAPIICIYFYF